MKPTEMHRLGRHGCHEISPKGWHTVPNLTGDYDLDATILHRSNRDMSRKLAQHLTPGNAYGPRGYHGYQGYHGDD
jgi:hypothetical protein